MTLEQQWDIKPLALSSKNPCLDRQPTWPHHLCNRDLGHVGDHCYVHQAGDTVIETWWPRSPEAR